MRFTIYNDEKTGTEISLKIDPILKKDISLEFRYKLGAVEIPAGYELGAVEIPAGDEQSFSTCSDDAIVGFTDDSIVGFTDDSIVGSADVFNVFS